MSDGDRGKRDQNLSAVFGAIALFGSVALAFAVGNTLGVNSGRDQVTAREHYERTKQNELRACSGRQGPTAIECVGKAIEAAQEQSDSRQDLYAQRDMSRWAFWLLVLTVATFGVTAVGVWFVKKTLDATLEAVEDTEKATNAMVEANSIARAAFEAETRPLLAIQESRNIESDFIAAFEILVVNHGKVPALVRKAESRVVRTPNARNPSQHPPGQVSLQIEFRKNEIISPNSPVWVRAQIGCLAHSNFWDISGGLFLEYSQVVGGDLKLYSTQIEFRAMWVKSVDGQANAFQIGRLDDQADGILVELVTPSLAMT